MNYAELKSWTEHYKRKNSYHMLSKVDQRIIDKLIADEVQRMSEGTIEKLQPSRDGEQLIKSWYSASKHVAKLERDLIQACANEAAAAKKVADWITPSDAKDGETFHMWYGDSMIAVTNDKVKIRLKGKAFLEL